MKFLSTPSNLTIVHVLRQVFQTTIHMLQHGVKADTGPTQRKHGPGDELSAARTSRIPSQVGAEL